ncbi:MAG: class I SAM-dependent methyltransferase [Clostridia bacterium]|nr:class I SAM-dependent methyltransferase [Clostridia bacterium]
MREGSMVIKLLEGVLRPGGLQITAELTKLCAFRPGDRVLDLGCGAGVTVEYLTEEWGLEAVGIDGDPLRVEEAKRRVPTLNILTADGADLPFGDELFDGIFAECSFSVMDYHEAVLGEVFRVLKPGGKLAISDLYIKEGFAREGKGPASASRVCLAGARTAQELRGLLAEHGFRLIFWQDASRSLAEFVAQYIMTYGSLDQAWLMPKEACPKGTSKKGIGYFFAVAQKVERNNGKRGGENV